MQTSPLSDQVSPPDATIEDLSRVISHLQSSIEQERVKISRSLHDDLGGLLVSAVMDLGWIEQHQASQELAERLGRIRGTLAAAIDMKRNLIEDLRPSLLDNFGLFAAFRWHVKHRCLRAGVECIENYPLDELDLRPEPLAGLFRTMQETLAVVLSEPSVKHIDVTAEILGNDLVLRTDHTHDGAEMADVYTRFPEQIGAIARRIDTLGGSFSVEKYVNGTRFLARFPLPRIIR